MRIVFSKGFHDSLSLSSIVHKAVHRIIFLMDFLILLESNIPRTHLRMREEQERCGDIGHNLSHERRKIGQNYFVGEGRTRGIVHIIQKGKRRFVEDFE